MEQKTYIRNGNDPEDAFFRRTGTAAKLGVAERRVLVSKLIKQTLAELRIASPELSFIRGA
jgi:hypothetical protein